MAEFDSSFNVYRHVDPTLARSYERRQHQRFDRLQFALEALKLLGSGSSRIVVFTSSKLEIRQGLDLVRGPHARWVMVGIPRDASAESIVLALARIEGAKRTPYALQATLSAAEAATLTN